MRAASVPEGDRIGQENEPFRRISCRRAAYRVPQWPPSRAAHQEHIVTINQFNATSTTDDVLAGIDLRGKRVFITGVSAGLGLETARALVAHGANVIGTARDLDKAHSATARVRAAAEQSGGSMQVIAMDLADLASVRAISDTMIAAGTPFDLVIANAGIMAPPFAHTKDGFELQFGTNVLGHYVLINRLAPLLQTDARVIILSSNGHRMADVDLEDPNFARTPYDPFVAYGRSKTADALLAVAFDARHRARGVRAASVHPGVILTELVRNMDPAIFEAAFAGMMEQHVALGNPPFVPKSPAQGAATTVWAGIVADAGAIGGHYCEDCQVGTLVPAGTDLSVFAPGVLAYAIDPAHAEALWAKAGELVGEPF
jgi:NAD(P)-dependent dehydrogenase (short-subunit alcohol dehydrogenase family)